MRNQIVILAAGKGTRMGNSKVPKVLVMLKNRPLIFYLLQELDKITQLVKSVVVIGYMYRQVREILGDDYSYAIQDKQLGTAHALLAAKYKITGENILVLYGDHPLIKAESLKELMRLHHRTQANISMFTATVPNFEGAYKPLAQFGRVVRNSEGAIEKIIEFKDATEEEKQIKEINPGIYMFNSQWLWQNAPKIKNDNAQAEYYLTDIVEVAIAHGETVQALPIDPKEVIGVNSPEDLKLAEQLISNK